MGQGLEHWPVLLLYNHPVHFELYSIMFSAPLLYHPVAVQKSLSEVDAGEPYND